MVAPLLMALLGLTSGVRRGHGAPGPHEHVLLPRTTPPPSTTIKAENIGWTLDPRVYEEPGQFTGCPDGQRNADESECLAAVQEATTALGLVLNGPTVKVVDAGADGWVPSGCSYSRGHGLQAIFNRNAAGRNWGSYPLVCINQVQPPKANLTGVVILLGQSNMVGRGRGEILDPTLLKSLGERDLGYYPANDACGISCNIDGSDCNLPSFMQRHCRWFDEFQISEQKHQSQLRPVRAQAWEQAFLGSESRFGPELMLGLTLNIDAPSAYTRVVVIKRAVLGVSMASFGVGEPLYNGLLRDYARVADLYGPAQTVPIGVMWMQGSPTRIHRATPQLTVRGCVASSRACAPTLRRRRCPLSSHNCPAERTAVPFRTKSRPRTRPLQRRSHMSDTCSENGRPHRTLKGRALPPSI